MVILLNAFGSADTYPHSELRKARVEFILRILLTLRPFIIGPQAKNPKDILRNAGLFATARRSSLHPENRSLEGHEFFQSAFDKLLVFHGSL